MSVPGRKRGKYRGAERKRKYRTWLMYLKKGAEEAKLCTHCKRRPRRPKQRWCVICAGNYKRAARQQQSLMKKQMVRVYQHALDSVVFPGNTKVIKKDE